MSLCNQVLDVADDLNKAILKEILDAEPAPELMKTAQVATRDIQAKLGRDKFALVAFTKEGSELRKYPINDAANVWLSCRYFAKTASKLPERARKIAAGMLKKACTLHRLPEPAVLKSYPLSLGNVYHEAYDLTKTASTIAVETVSEDGSKHFYALGQRYAMPNEEFVKKAAAYFADYQGSFEDAYDRHQFAHNVLERAKELKVDLQEAPILRKFASEGYGDIVDVQIRMRKDLVHMRPELSQALDKVASYRGQVPAQQFAKLLHTFDKKASLTRHYDAHLADAFKATFEQRSRPSSGYVWEDMEKNSYSEKELEEAFDSKYDKIKGYFGATIADQLKKHGCSIFESLPVDAKETVGKIVKGEI